MNSTHEGSRGYALTDTKMPTGHDKFKIVQGDVSPILNFEEIYDRAQKFAWHIESSHESLVDLLLQYESYEVAFDEINRTLDLLKSLDENKSYFVKRIGEIASFLPRNQPLYALTCFVVIPSFMAKCVHVRIPHGMRSCLPKLFDHLKIFEFFPNLFVSQLERLEFLRERSAIVSNVHTGETRPVTEAVIFTGTPAHADQLRVIFDRRTLFIANGSGHNPVVVAEGSILSDAVEAALTLTLYNQGQDCGAPNSILVHERLVVEFLNQLRKGIAGVKVGPHADRSCRVGPINDPSALPDIASIVIDNREYLDWSTQGIINCHACLVEPTIFVKPLSAGGNFRESFSPMIFVQQYVDDHDLALYFESSSYFRNAMYVTVFGKSQYVDDLVGKKLGNRVLHDSASVLRDRHLHSFGAERGTQPYGGLGFGASSYSVGGKVVPGPTLPQRDIFQQLVEPYLGVPTPGKDVGWSPELTELKTKNVEKLLRRRPDSNSSAPLSAFLAREGRGYIDSTLIARGGMRYVVCNDRNLFFLLPEPNFEYADSMSERDRRMVSETLNVVGQKSKLLFDDFVSSLYAIPKADLMDGESIKKRQRHFFEILYELLFRQKSGPNLGHFLWALDAGTIGRLFDV